MTELVKATYQELSVSFTENAWFNATTVAEKFGKRPIDWLRFPETERYIEALCEISNCEKISLLKSKRGRHQSGT